MCFKTEWVEEAECLASDVGIDAFDTTGRYSYDLIRLKTENEKFKSAMICKICNDRQVQTLTLPCAHVVCCEPCTEANDNCPLCDAKILGYVRIYM